MRSLSSILVTFFPAALAVLEPRQFVGTSTCPDNYPEILNDTSFLNLGFGFNLAVQAQNSAYNGHNIQLRTLSSGIQTVVVDAVSPVLLTQMRDGAIYSGLFPPFSDGIGPTGVLTNTTAINNVDRECFDFSNTTVPVYGAGEVNSRDGWYLVGESGTGTYSLFHNVPDDLSNGFLICPIEGNSEKYYQLFYNQIGDTGGALIDVGDCEFVGLQTTIAPRIIDGNCTI